MARGARLRACPGPGAAASAFDQVQCSTPAAHGVDHESTVEGGQPAAVRDGQREPVVVGDLLARPAAGGG
jgi:hypothetical protein